jgi:hypothetical protein
MRENKFSEELGKDTGFWVVNYTFSISLLRLRNRGVRCIRAKNLHFKKTISDNFYG